MAKKDIQTYKVETTGEMAALLLKLPPDTKLFIRDGGIGAPALPVVYVPAVADPTSIPPSGGGGQEWRSNWFNRDMEPGRFTQDCIVLLAENKPNYFLSGPKPPTLEVPALLRDGIDDVIENLEGLADEERDPQGIMLKEAANLLRKIQKMFSAEEEKVSKNV